MTTDDLATSLLIIAVIGVFAMLPQIIEELAKL